MPTIINNPPGSGDTGSGSMIAITITVVVVLLLLLFFGLPLLRGTAPNSENVPQTNQEAAPAPGDTIINVPDQLDIDIKE